MLPVMLSIEPGGKVEAKIGNQMQTEIRKCMFRGSEFSGTMTGDIETPDANRRPYDLQWDLTLRGKVLSGVLYAVGKHPSRGVLLGHWVELKQQE